MLGLIVNLGFILNHQIIFNLILFKVIPLNCKFEIVGM